MRLVVGAIFRYCYYRYQLVSVRYRYLFINVLNCPTFTYDLSVPYR
jgi:uncharacterized membrane protein YpjA